MTPTTPDTEYAFWTIPATGFRITYALSVFHEIDFHVNEGFRRIPHGGIETGGLLVGHRTNSSAQIDAFRLIHCEHAFGPSFVLSDHDLAAMREQIAASQSDPELAGLEVLGWFIAHTRTPLRMNDTEAGIFDQLFPGAGQITLLIKPERFQPTRFGFLARGVDGRVPRDATQQAIILPLPGRPGRSDGGPIPSLPAPPETLPKPAAAQQPAAPPPQPAAPATPQSPAARIPLDRQAAAPPPPLDAPSSQGPLLPPESPSVASSEAEERQPLPPPQRPQEFSLPSPSPFTPSRPEATAHSATSSQPTRPTSRPDPERITSLVPSIARPSSLPSIDEIRRRRWEYMQGTGAVSPNDTRPEQLQLTGTVQRENLRSNLRLTMILFIAAAIGCGVGYLGYLQLPSATIPLSVQAQPSTLLVTWPAQLTRDSVYSAIRIDDGQQIALSPQQRAAGEATIAGAGDNVKIELIAAHWMRDSRGIIRYIKPVLPIETLPVDTGKPTTLSTTPVGTPFGPDQR